MKILEEQKKHCVQHFQEILDFMLFSYSKIFILLALFDLWNEGIIFAIFEIFLSVLLQFCLYTIYILVWSKKNYLTQSNIFHNKKKISKILNTLNKFIDWCPMTFVTLKNMSYFLNKWTNPFCVNSFGLILILGHKRWNKS